MYVKLIIPLDGSKRSASVLPYAVAFAQNFAVPLELFHVLAQETDAACETGQPRPIENAEVTDLKEAFQYLREIGKSLPESVEAKSSAETGPPAEKIIDKAAQDPAALIMMAARGFSGMKRWLLGSVTAKVLQASRNPLLLVQGAEDGVENGRAAVERVLVPLDGSPLAERVFPHVIAVAKGMELQVELLESYNLPAAAVTPVPLPVGSHVVTREKIRERVEEYLEAKAQVLKDKGIRKVSTLAMEGDAAGNIIDVAHNSPGSIVVISRNGRSGIRRWVLGSVAERVAYHSEEPVLVIPPENINPGPCSSR